MDTASSEPIRNQMLVLRCPFKIRVWFIEAKQNSHWVVNNIQLREIRNLKIA